ncbi:MAG: recombination protein O N-terminal domain-containing protein [Patescibacteria group bacterium]
MAYSIYQTDAIILGIRDIQEHDLMIRAFSPLFGYIRIISKGGRKGTSKLRANIQDFSLVHIAAVKGKEFFILTDIKCIFSFIQSRSVVNFLKGAEALFFDDDDDHGTRINTDIYGMLIRMCKHIIWLVSEKKDTGEAIRFFTIYVKGLQGFTGKMNIDGVLEYSDSELHFWIEEHAQLIQELESKLAL